MRTFMAAALMAVFATTAVADGAFSEGSEAKGWKNLAGREPAIFAAEVVDILCHLTGECVEKCGDGRRQMGLVREADGVLVLAAKNSQSSFNGATVDLAAYCGMRVTVDGFLIGDPEVTPTKVYMVQRIQRMDSEKWAKAARWTRTWKRNNKDLADRKGPWFRHDPDVAAAIEADGWLGLGAEVDKAFIAENY